MQGKIIHHYRIIKPLGAGAFGQTYLAQNLNLPDEPVCVVKQLKPQSTDPESVKAAKMLFDREAETLRRIGGHERIPQILDYFEEDQEFYLVQQYIEGKTLREELGGQPPWDESQAILFLQEMLQIVEFVHSQQIIHRDVKPENIIRRTSDQKLFLIDFGAVKQSCYDREQPSSTIIHSRGYSPPEQLAGIPKPNSDIYALGMTCIEALTGAKPESLVQLRETGTQKISWSGGSRICPEFKSIIDRMVCIDSQNRYSSAGCVMQALDALKNVGTGYPDNYTPTEITTPHLPTYTPTELKTDSFMDSYLDPEDFEQPLKADSILKPSDPLLRKKLNARELSLELSECLKDRQKVPQPRKVVDTTRQWLKKRLLIVSGLIFTVVGLPLVLIFIHKKPSQPPKPPISKPVSGVEPLATFKKETDFKEHSSSIEFLAFAPDRKTLISGSESGLVNLRDMQDSLTRTLTQTQSKILAMSSSANGNTLAIATEGRSIELWDLKNYKKMNQISTQQLVWSLAFSQNGEGLAAGVVGGIKLWKIQPKLSEMKPFLYGNSQPIAAIAFTPTDVLAGGSDDGTVKIFISHLTNHKASVRST
ncbi:MAG: serine/threonine-protein kinase [Phormidesmis sp. CAN_BIN44]|nr:serine/threonine-protein kinase [Phormidesmis sp. CAN_BIN44]